MKNDLITIGQGDDYTTICLSFFLKKIISSRLIAVDSSKEQPRNGDIKSIQLIDFAGNLA